jgi:hypothetical protein
VQEIIQTLKPTPPPSTPFPYIRNSSKFRPEMLAIVVHIFLFPSWK